MRDIYFFQSRIFFHQVFPCQIFSSLKIGLQEINSEITLTSSRPPPQSQMVSPLLWAIPLETVHTLLLAQLLLRNT